MRPGVCTPDDGDSGSGRRRYHEHRTWPLSKQKGPGSCQEDPVDDELIRWCAFVTHAACSRMTAQHLKAVRDSVGQARCLPARPAWDSKATAHAALINLLAGLSADHPVPARLLTEAAGAVHGLLI